MLVREEENGMNEKCQASKEMLRAFTPIDLII